MKLTLKKQLIILVYLDINFINNLKKNNSTFTYQKIIYLRLIKIHEAYVMLVIVKVFIFIIL